MLQHVVETLACPHGEPSLRTVDGGVSCPAGHRFDLARQGYLNLLIGPAPAAADTATMVAARERIQTEGHHAALTDALVHAVRAGTTDGPGRRRPSPAMVVDLGAGTGHHLAAVVERTGADAGLALDISKYAARRAARVHPRVGAVVCDVWRRLPLRDATAAVVLDVFAPRNTAEIARILVPGGTLVVATPAPRHLAPLVDRLGLIQVGDDKLDRLDRDLGDVAVRRSREVVDTVAVLDHASVGAMVAMGPSIHHLDGHDLAVRIADLPDPIEVAISVTVSRYRRR